MIPQNRWKWFGHSAHFICGRWCRFHLATKIGPWLISTVGEYVHPHHSGASEQTEAAGLKENYPGEDIGCDCKYETMVFLAGALFLAEAPGKEPKCGCGLPALYSGSEKDFQGYNDAGSATKGHYKMCLKWAKKKGRK